MIAVERLVQKIYPGKWEELEQIEKRYAEIEAKAGFPAKKRMQCVIGGLDQNTLVTEREWECLAQMEATYEKAFALPEYQALGKDLLSIVQSSQRKCTPRCHNVNMGCRPGRGLANLTRTPVAGEVVSSVPPGFSYNLHKAAR